MRKGGAVFRICILVLCGYLLGDTASTAFVSAKLPQFRLGVTQHHRQLPDCPLQKVVCQDRGNLEHHVLEQTERAARRCSRRAVSFGGATATLGVLFRGSELSTASAESWALPESFYVRLNNGVQICKLQTGLLQLSPKTSLGGSKNTEDEVYWAVDKDQAVAAIKRLVDAGMTTFDLAGYYGDAEDIVGEYTRQNGWREGVCFNTKWIPTGSAPKSKDEVYAAVQNAKKRMGVDPAVMQFYWWDYDKPYYVDMLAHAQSLVNDGVLRGIGLTGMDTKRVREIVDSGVRVSTVQGSFSVVDTRPRDGGMAALCQEQGTVFVAHGALCGGLLSERWLGAAEPEEQGRRLPTSQLRKYYRWVTQWGDWALFQHLLQTLKAIADRKRVSVSTVALRWVLSQAGVGSVVVGARLGAPEQERQSRENLRALSTDWTLSDDDMRAIAAVQTWAHAACLGQERGRPLLDSLGDVGNEFHVKARGLKKSRNKPSSS